MACLQGMMPRQLVFLGRPWRKDTCNQSDLGVTTNQMCSIKWLVHILDPAGTIQTCSSLADECWCLPAPRLSRWLWAQRAGHQNGWIQSLTLSYPDGSLSQQASHQNGRCPDDRQRWIRHLPLASPPPRHLWSTWRDWEAGPCTLTGQRLFMVYEYSQICFRLTRKFISDFANPEFQTLQCTNYSFYIWRPIKLTWKTENNKLTLVWGSIVQV